MGHSVTVYVGGTNFTLKQNCFNQLQPYTLELNTLTPYMCAPNLPSLLIAGPC